MAIDRKQRAKSKQTKKREGRQRKRNIPNSRQEKSPIRSLHQTLGNQAVQEFVKSDKLQTELRTNRPGDRSDQAIRRLASWQPDEATLERWRRVSESEPLRLGYTGRGQELYGNKIGEINIHRDKFADRLTTAHGAQAITVEGEVYLGADVNDQIVRHEFVHALQQTNEGVSASVPALEQEAGEVASGRRHSVELSAHPEIVLRHPALSVLRRAGTWLARRATRTISKHIARHGRQIAGRGVHTVFRIPRKIRSYVRQALDDAERLARTTTQHGARDVLEGEGIRVFQQATGTPGKFRVVVEKAFRSPIGTRGEHILRVVIDQSGRLVTAFPVDRFLTLGLTSAAATAFTATTAEAAERIHERVEMGTQEPEQDVLTWIIDFLVAPSVANEGEQLWLDVRDMMQTTVQQVISEIEEEEQMSLGPEQRQAIEDLVAAAIGTPMILEDETMWNNTEE